MTETRIQQIVDVITENVIHKLKEETYNPDTEEYQQHCSMLCEMATFGEEMWGNKQYNIAIHGVMSGDRPTPHIHIYYKDEKNTKNPRFNFEISLMDILTKGQINLVRQTDYSKHIDNKNRNKCSWTGYHDIEKGLALFLTQNNEMPIFGEIASNLKRAIYEWNKETDYGATINQRINVMGRQLKQQGIDKNVLQKYQYLLNDYPPKVQTP